MPSNLIRKTDARTDFGGRLVEHCEARLSALREQIEGDADHDTTIKLRGRLAEVKELLRLLGAPAAAPRTSLGLSVEPASAGDHDDD